MPYKAKWRGPKDPPAALLTLTACRFHGAREEALDEALAALGVELVECCDPDGPPCGDCAHELEGDQQDRAHDAERDRRLMEGEAVTCEGCGNDAWLIDGLPLCESCHAERTGTAP